MAHELAPRDAFIQLIDLWALLADNALQIAQNKRALYNAYVKEGFTEAQALELIKSASGIGGL